MALPGQTTQMWVFSTGGEIPLVGNLPECSRAGREQGLEKSQGGSRKIKQNGKKGESKVLHVNRSNLWLPVEFAEISY